MAEDGVEVGVVPGDDHQAVLFSSTYQPAVCTGLFFLTGNGFVNFGVFLFVFVFSYFVH